MQSWTLTLAEARQACSSLNVLLRCFGSWVTCCYISGVLLTGQPLLGRFTTAASHIAATFWCFPIALFIWGIKNAMTFMVDFYKPNKKTMRGISNSIFLFYFLSITGLQDLYLLSVNKMFHCLLPKDKNLSCLCYGHTEVRLNTVRLCTYLILKSDGNNA